jgi:hypothetical protein
VQRLAQHSAAFLFGVFMKKEHREAWDFAMELYGEKYLRSISPSQCAAIIVDLAEELSQALKKAIAAKKKKKRDWIAEQRKSIRIKRRSTCEHCFQHIEVTEAHHIVPLEEQYEIGMEYAEHDIIWLCPTHHAQLHILIRDANWQKLERYQKEFAESRAASDMVGFVKQYLAKLKHYKEFYVPKTSL